MKNLVNKKDKNIFFDSDEKEKKVNALAVYIDMVHYSRTCKRIQDIAKNDKDFSKLNVEEQYFEQFLINFHTLASTFYKEFNFTTTPEIQGDGQFAVKIFESSKDLKNEIEDIVIGLTKLIDKIKDAKWNKTDSFNKDEEKYKLRIGVSYGVEFAINFNIGHAKSIIWAGGVVNDSKNDLKLDFVEKSENVIVINQKLLDDIVDFDSLSKKLTKHSYDSKKVSFKNPDGTNIIGNDEASTVKNNETIYRRIIVYKK